MLDAALTSLANQGTNYLVAGFNPKRSGRQHPNIAPYGTVFQSKEGKELILAIGDDRQFAALCDVLGKPELATGPLFANNLGRVQHRELLNAALQKLIAEFDLEELLEILNERYVPAGAVKNVGEALDVPAASALRLQEPENELQGLKTVAFRLENLERQTEMPRPPHFGEHTREVLSRFYTFPATGRA